ncbi:MAG: Fur family transcriptional regulator [Trueperella sp.]|nr:Fur family transcriptional regulator [Trueperella sp.]
MTRQRTAIIDFLRQQDSFLSTQEVHQALVSQGNEVGLATVYRNLQTLATNGDLDVVRQENSETQLFRLCADSSHHHHLVCRNCGVSEEITSADIEGWSEQIAKQYGFTQISHFVELFGLCAQCAVPESTT